jgi:hypothetical protein
MDSVPDLDLFISLGFIDPRRQGDANMTSTRRHDDAAEVETETEVETEADNTVCPPEAEPSDVEKLVGIVSDTRVSLGLSALRGGDEASKRYIRARIKEYGYDLVEAVARYAPHDRWIRDDAEVALGPIFSPKSFPKILARMESPDREDGLSAGDRKIISMRERLEREAQ